MTTSTDPEELRTMWRYYCGKYGHVDALRQQFPDLLASDPVLAQSVAMMEAGRLAIEGRMRELGAEQ